MGVREQVQEGRNWIQKVGEWVPGFRGYYAKEHRRDADALVREAAASRLKAASDAIGEACLPLIKAKNLEEVERLQRLAQRLAALADRARTAARGYAGFFDAVKVREDELDRIYEQDLRLLGAAEAVRREPSEKKAAEIEGILDARKESLLDLSN